MTIQDGFDHPQDADHTRGTRSEGLRTHEQSTFDRSRTDGEGGSIVLHEEELRIRTERIPTGRVTFRKRVVTEERTVVVTVRREELEIIEEDLTADAPPASEAGLPAVTGERLHDEVSSAADLTHSPEGDIEIILYAERPVVTLETVAAERVQVHRGSITENQDVTAEVFHEEAVLEREGEAPDHQPRR
ncbi:DUF2382 domain-containing protein [Gephyromycinifex aptenodytis]|uniref:DUF2382 domain-containing protein n=1 Tax=Gephyromycinifex aptenodytis TaxID=2716227 RepID=UPI001445A403|nr:DUF2382 domain-containing protein [Gephyromycinifex aptenodytis]